MKKKPREIFSILLNSLNNLEISKEYSINEISENSGLHWYTTNEYLEILTQFKLFAPTIQINERNKKVQLIERSRYYDKLTISQKILLNLFERKAFDANSAISLKDSNLGFIDVDADIELYIDDLKAKNQIQVIPTEKSKDEESVEGFILKNGKEIVHSIYNKITTELFSVKKNKEENSLEDLKDPVEEIELLKLRNTEIDNEKKALLKQNSDLIEIINILIKSKYKEETDSQSIPMQGYINSLTGRLVEGDLGISTANIPSSNDITDESVLDAAKAVYAKQ